MYQDDIENTEDVKPVVIKEPVKEILIDGFSSALWSNDIVQLNLYRDFLPPNPGDENERVLVSRLSMGISALLSFQLGLADLIKELKLQGYFGEETKAKDEKGENNES